MVTEPGPDALEAFTEDARRWLDQHATVRTASTDGADLAWGEGEFSVSVFHSLSFDEERELL